MTANRAMNERRTMRVLDLASIGVIAIAIVLWFWPVAVPDTQGPSSGTPSAGGPSTDQARSVAQLAQGAASRAQGAASADSLITFVVDGNVFSATRRAPRTRFVVPGREPAVNANAMLGTMEPAAVDSSTAGDVYPRLSGIVVASGERRALLQLAAADGAPRLYRVGEVHAGYRVVRIDSTLVVLSSRTGTRTVRLSPRATPDSLEMIS